MSTQKLSLPRVLPYMLIAAGAIGYICAFIIMFDKLKILDNPQYIPSCNLDPIISCGNIMQSNQANAFGFPNPFIGLGGFPVLIVVGLAMLAGATFKRWFWLTVNAGLLFAAGFVHWLFFESVYRIQALCPWCVIVWIVSITSFWYVTLYNIDNSNIRLPKGRSRNIYAFVRRHHLDILIVWFLIIAALILQHFWYYYGRNF